VYSLLQAFRPKFCTRFSSIPRLLLVFSLILPDLIILILSCKAVPEHHAMKAYWGVEIYLHAFLNSVLDGGE
jgi:hypothetical protein